MAKRQRRVFTREFRALSVVRESRKSVADRGAEAGSHGDCATELGRSMRAGFRWALTTEEREEVGRLRQENRMLIEDKQNRTGGDQHRPYGFVSGYVLRPVDGSDGVAKSHA